ncbi:hypothetical protein F4819DRAFT_489106 [Hypoxylon fuscum]|nr:hypothetical protein F4819DRAFT_489106 [Hypoxylon fuscum]
MDIKSMEELEKVLSRLPVLQGKENFTEWKKAILDLLRTNKLEKHVLEDLPIPAENSPESKTFDYERQFVNLLVCRSLSDDFKATVKNGWKLATRDTKGVWDLIATTIPDDSIIENYVQWFGRMDVGQYFSLGQFLVAVVEMKNRLEATTRLASAPMKHCKGFVSWLILATLKDYDKVWQERLHRDFIDQKYTWDDLVKQIAYKAKYDFENPRPLGASSLRQKKSPNRCLPSIERDPVQTPV